MANSEKTGLEIAIIGYAGRFNTCGNVNEYWNSLCAGVETFQVFSDEELEGIGVPEEVYQQQNYVKVNGNLRDKDCFDAQFFGYTPQEGIIMDPQVRVFHEVVWNALEMAGYLPEKTNKKIGLYASAANNSLWETLMGLNGENQVGAMATSYFINKDYLCSLVAYNLNLKGPAIAIQTACSSSLVAVHQAARALLTGDCQIAVAGGVRVSLLKRGGYTYQENLILSPDGHCRVFDADAQGTLDGEGAGVVVLKKYQDALRDGDTIHAVIKGSAINNDGQEKMGYTTPSINGQIQVIKNAIKIAKVDPNSVSYIEAHGTGTKIGDPVEINALKRAYAQNGIQTTAIGSVKSNIGHLDTAAGIASLIKVIMMLKNRKIPASLHYHQPNPALEIENSSFFINKELTEWESSASMRRAGISSFGIGGTNCHLIVEEAQAEEQKPAREAITYPFNLSAKSEKKLKEYTAELVTYLKDNQDFSLADMSYTLNCGRADFNYRTRLMAHSADELLQKLQQNPSSNIELKNKLFDACVFVFSGQGSQYVRMGQELYEGNAFFKTQMDHCFALIEQHHGLSLKEVLFSKDAGAETQINETLYTQLSLFSICYALATLLIECGVKPAALIGHSIGEYAGAVISGVMKLEEAVQIIGKRAALMQGLERGKMCAVFCEESILKEMLPSEITIAAVNSKQLVVVSGDYQSMDLFQKKLESKDIDYRELRTSHAFHSPMMEGILEEYKIFLSNFNFQKNQIPLISNLTGDFFDQPIDATYWGQHLRQTVRFYEGVNTLLKQGHRTFIEIGPGDQLTKLIGKTASKETPLKTIVTLKKAGTSNKDLEVLLEGLSKLWQSGKTINWLKLYDNQLYKRIPLPGTLFEKTKFPVPANILNMLDNFGKEATMPQTEDSVAEWMYHTVWLESRIKNTIETNYWQNRQVLVFCDKKGAADKLMTEIGSQNTTFITVKAGASYQKISPTSYIINEKEIEEYSLLIEGLKADYPEVSTILHCWGWDKLPDSKLENLDQALQQGYLSLAFLAKSLGSNDYDRDKDLIVLTQEAIDAKSGDHLNPLQAMSIGALKVISVEYNNLRCKLIDIPVEDLQSASAISQLNREIIFKDHQITVAYRQAKRYVPVIKKYKNNRATNNLLKPEGCYLIPGGLGGMGLSIAYDIARQEKAKLALVSRRSFPSKDQWAAWVSNHGAEDKTSKAILKIQEMEAFGAQVCLLKADVSDRQQMAAVIKEVETTLAPINGVIWAAGVIDYDGVIQRRKPEKFIANIQPKVHGLLILEQLLDFEKLDFVSLFSSIGNVYYKDKFGQVAYNVANEFLDAYALGYSGKCQISTLVWCDWKEVGMSVDSITKRYEGISSTEIEDMLEDGLLPEEGVAVFRKFLSYPAATYVVSKSDLVEGVKKHHRRGEEIEAEAVQSDLPTFERPSLSTPYEAPTAELEIHLADICRLLFGIDKVGVHDDFLELGGDSLMAIQFINQIKKELGVKISLEEFFSNPTVAAFAKLIANKLGTSDSAASTESEVIPRAEEKNFYSLSSAQKRIYFLYEFDKDSTAYNMPKIIKTKGNLDRPQLQRAFEKLIERHENFRTTFEIIDQQPVQIVADRVAFKINFQDGVDKEEAAIIDDFIQPFDLNNGPLLRVAVVDTAPQEFLLMIDFHHIISDGFSHGILLSEFMSLYKEESLPPLQLQYKDFAEWQQSETQQALIAQERGFWLEAFAELPEALQLPTDFKRPLIKSYAGEVIGFELDKTQGAKLKALAEQEGVTLFMMVFAIYNVLLGKLSNSEDIVVGSPVAGRQHADLENMIGMFVNTLPIRNFPKGKLTFKEFLSKVKAKTLACFDNQSFQYEELLDELKIERDTARNPLFDVLFVSDSFKEPDFKIPGLELLPYTGVHRVSKFDLTLTSIESNGTLLFSFEYASAILKKETIEKFITYFQNIIKAVTGDIETKLSDLLILSVKEREKILLEFNETETYYPREKTIVDVFRTQVRKTPQNIALRFGEEKMTYAMLEEQSDKIASYLKDEMAVQPGDLIGLMLERELALMPVVFGILKTGAAYVPIDPHFPFERIKKIVEDAGLKTLITREKHLAEKSEIDISIIDLEKKLPLILSREAQVVDVEFSSDHLAYVIYTSGSTGNPKGVMIEHHSVINRIFWMNKKYPITEKDVLLQKTPIVFDVSVWELFWWSFTGASLTLLQPEEEKSPKDILKTIAESGVTTLHFVPSMLSVFLGELNKTTNYDNLQCLRQVFVSGEALNTEHVYQFGQTINKNCGSRLINLYGPTEATVDVSYYECDFDAIPEAIPIGKPIDNIQLYVLDNNTQPVPIGVQGELHIAGVGLARGYLNNQKLTDEKFIDNPFTSGTKLYKTGDLASWLPNGDIAFWGRIDNQVKIRGFRMELGEIEARLLTNDRIKEAVVLAKIMGGEKELVAYYVSETEIEVMELRAYLTVTLPEYMVPAFYVQLDAFPLTVNGKLNRSALPDPERNAGANYQPPSNDTEEKLVQIWSEVLNTAKENISIYANFFDIGGHSLKIIHMNRLVNETFQTNISVANIFRLTTIHAIANYLMNGDKKIQEIEEGLDEREEALNFIREL